MCLVLAAAAVLVPLVKGPTTALTAVPAPTPAPCGVVAPCLLPPSTLMPGPGTTIFHSVAATLPPPTTYLLAVCGYNIHSANPVHGSCDVSLITGPGEDLRADIGPGSSSVPADGAHVHVVISGRGQVTTRDGLTDREGSFPFVVNGTKGNYGPLSFSGAVTFNGLSTTAP